MWPAISTVNVDLSSQHYKRILPLCFITLYQLMNWCPRAILLTKINSISHGLNAWICNYMNIKMWLINTMWPSDTIWWNITGSTLAQVMACCLTASSHYPNQCWLLISEILWHSPQSNVTANAQATILYTVMSLKFILSKSLPHLPGVQWVNTHSWLDEQSSTILWLSLILMWLHIHAKLKLISNSNFDPDNKVFSGSMFTNFK